jgi:hypothetical protein
MKTKYAAARITIGVPTGFLGAGLGYSAYELHSRLFPQPFFLQPTYLEMLKMGGEPAVGVYQFAGSLLLVLVGLGLLVVGRR